MVTLVVARVPRLWATQVPNKSVQITATWDAFLGKDFIGPSALAKLPGRAHPAPMALQLAADTTC